MGWSRFTSWSLLLVTSLLLFIAKASICAPETDRNGEGKLDELSLRAQAAQKQGNYAAAAAAYEELARLRPDIGEIWANAGLMHQFLNDYSKADRDFKTALSKNPKLYVPNLFMGLNRLRARQPSTALPYLKTAAVLNPNDKQAAMGLGRAYVGIRDYGEAVLWFERARHIDPLDADAWYELGVCYLELQNAAASEMNSRVPDDVFARVLVAGSFLDQGRAKEAIQILERYRNREDLPCLESELGFAYIQVGLLADAEEAFHDEMTKCPGCLLANLGLARISLARGDYRETLHRLENIKDREPNFLTVYLQRIWTGLDEEHLRAISTEIQNFAIAQDPVGVLIIQSAQSRNPAISDVDLTVSSASQSDTLHKSPAELWTEGRYGACANTIRNIKSPLTPALIRLLQRCAFYAGDYRLALNTSRRALQSASRDPEALYWKARSSQELSAIAFKQMYAVAPDSPRIKLLMAELHRTQEEYTVAESEYNEVLKIAGPEEEALSAHLGLAYIYLHSLEDEKAIDQLQPVLRSDPSHSQANSILGMVLVHQRRYDDAIPHLKEALRDTSLSSLPELHSSLAKCYAAREEYAEAREELKPALASDPMGTFHYQLYQVCLKMGDQNAASAALKESQRLRESKARAEREHMGSTF